MLSVLMRNADTTHEHIALNINAVKHKYFHEYLQEVKLSWDVWSSVTLKKELPVMMVLITEIRFLN